MTRSQSRVHSGGIEAERLQLRTLEVGRGPIRALTPADMRRMHAMRTGRHDSDPASSDAEHGGATDAAPVEDPSLLRLSQEDLDRMIAERESAAYALGLQDGVRQEQQRAQDEAERSAAANAARLESLFESFGQQIDGMREKVADDLLEVGVLVGSAIACRSIAADIDRIVPVLERAFAMLGDEYGTLRLSLNPEDRERAERWLQPRIGARTLQVLTDPMIRAGGCRIQADDTVVDLSIEQRIRRAYAGLGLETDKAVARTADVADVLASRPEGDRKDAREHDREA